MILLSTLTAIGFLIYGSSSQGAKRAKMDNFGENFFNALFDNLGCIVQTRIDRPRILSLKRKNAILVKMNSFEPWCVFLPAVMSWI